LASEHITSITRRGISLHQFNFQELSVSNCPPSACHRARRQASSVTTVALPCSLCLQALLQLSTVQCRRASCTSRRKLRLIKSHLFEAARAFRVQRSNLLRWILQSFLHFPARGSEQTLFRTDQELPGSSDDDRQQMPAACCVTMSAAAIPRIHFEHRHPARYRGLDLASSGCRKANTHLNLLPNDYCAEKLPRIDLLLSSPSSHGAGTITAMLQSRRFEDGDKYS